MRMRDKRTHKKFFNAPIKWVYSGYNGGKPIDALVVACDYWIGITIVEASNPENFLTCINGPLSSQGLKKVEAIDGYMKMYDKKFEYFLSIMRSTKVFNVDEKNAKSGHKVSRSGKMNTCSFL